MLRMVPLPVPGRIDQMAIPAALVHAHRPHVHAMLAGVTDDLGGRVETHRLGVEQRAAEHVRVMAFHP